MGGDADKGKFQSFEDLRRARGGEPQDDERAASETAALDDGDTIPGSAAPAPKVDVGAVHAKIGACDFKAAVASAGDSDELRGMIRAAIDTEKGAQALLQAGREMEAAGDFAGALSQYAAAKAASQKKT